MGYAFDLLLETAAAEYIWYRVVGGYLHVCLTMVWT